MIQQAIVLVLTPIFDPDFSESSFGYRPYRSAHGAVKQVQATIRNGGRWCVDTDLSKFFDRVCHDLLMARVSRKVHDKRLLKLIGRYLRAGVMVDGLAQPSQQGTMQGGPLSPLLSNVLLDALDKELEKRGLPFVRYADDFVIFTKSKVAARRVQASIERFITSPSAPSSPHNRPSQQPPHHHRSTPSNTAHYDSFNRPATLPAVHEAKTKANRAVATSAFLNRALEHRLINRQ